MELSDEKLRQIVHETLHELGDEAAADLVRKVVRAVIQQLQQKGAPASQAQAKRLPIIESPASSVPEKPSGSSPGY